MKRINALDPDLVFITGDFFDPEFPDDEKASKVLTKLKPREGTFAVSGNHEFYAGIHDQTANRFKAHGMTCDLDQALFKINPALPSILLAHQPKEFSPAITKKIDLILSGHTHAGQIFPFVALVRIAYRFIGGLYRLGPDTELIVCTGTGYWGPPMRVGTDSQIVVVEFKY